ETTATQLLHFIAAHLVTADGTEAEDHKDAHAFAKVAGVDLGAWKLTADWLGKRPRAWILAAVVEAGGKDADKQLQKFKGAELANKSLAILQAAKWTPAPLRAPEPPKPVANKAAPKKASRKAAKKVPAKKSAKR